MTEDQRRHLLTLCRKIEIETDENTFLGLVSELGQLLEIHQRASIRANAEIEVNARRAIYNPYLVLAANPQIPELLSSIIEATAADFGNIQLFDSSRSGLRIVAQRGFRAEFLSFFETVSHGSFACGAAMNNRSRVTVTDILSDPLFQDHETRGVMLRAGVRACQSTPLFDPHANFIGVASTHFQRPTEFETTPWNRVDAVLSEFTGMLPSIGIPLD